MEEIAGIYARQVPEIDRYVQIGVASGKLVQVSFPETPDGDAGEDHELLDRLEAVLAGDAAAADLSDVEVALTVPTDQRTVLQTLRTVPVGTTTDPEALARMTPGLDPEDDETADAVHRALAGNPLPLVVPDHRVDGAEGATPGPVRRRLRELEEIDG